MRSATKVGAEEIRSGYRIGTKCGSNKIKRVLRRRFGLKKGERSCPVLDILTSDLSDVRGALEEIREFSQEDEHQRAVC